MAIFFLLFLGYCFGQLYIFFCLGRVFGPRLWLIPVFLFFLLMLAPIVARFSGFYHSPQPQVWQAVFFWMGFVMLLVPCFLMAETVMAGIRLTAFLQKSGPLVLAPRFFTGALALAILLFCYSVYTAYHPQIVTIALKTAKLPSGSAPLRIAVASDVHISALVGTKTLQRLADTVAKEQPDIFVSLGDLVDTNVSNKPEELAILQSIKAPLGKIAITGNHEAYFNKKIALDFTQKAGFTVLQGELLHTAGILFAGVDDEQFAHTRNAPSTSIAKVLSQADPGHYTIVLKHKPIVPKEMIGKFDLMLSGHTHGGQIWPGIFLVYHQFGFWQGMTELLGNNKEKSHLFLTNGYGFWGPPVRLFANPELLIIELSPE